MKKIKFVARILLVLFCFNLFIGNKVEAIETKMDPLVWIDNPVSNSTMSNTTELLVRGWALNKSGIKEVKIYLSDSFIGSAEIGKSRPDVRNVYKQYKDADKSGYEYKIDASKLGTGSKKIRVQAIGNDGIKEESSITVNLAKLTPNMWIDEPTAELNVQGNVKVRGWAINGSGIKEVKIYVNDSYIGNADIGKYRPDVNKVYPNYMSSDKSGYEYTISSTTIGTGSKKIKVQAIGNDGTIQEKIVRIDSSKLAPYMWIDEPVANSTTEGNIKVRGWAINASGIEEIKVYVNDSYIGSAAIGKSRPDVKNVYPKYSESDKSGYEYTIDTSKIGAGTKKIRVQAIGKDGTKQESSSIVKLEKLAPYMWIDEPVANSATGGNIKVRGWAINGSGIEEVKVYVNDSYIGSASIGKSRPDVKNVYPKYSGSDKSGYEYTIDTSKMGSGTKKIKVQAIGKDGTIQESSSIVKLEKLDPYMWIDEPIANSTTKGDVKVRGWAINQSGIQEVKIYINNTYIGNASIGKSRPDVKNVYPKYSEADKSGYEYIINSSKITDGLQTIKVQAIGKDGTTQESSVKINNGQLLIVVDPGHDYGGDGGAVATHNGVTYSETELNMQLAVKLKASLEAKGYKIVMTRQLWERPTSASARDSLKARTDLANGLKADLFISIHHDKSSNTSTTGVSTHYSSYKPGIEKDGITVGNDPNGWYSGVDIDTTPSKEAIKGRDLANKIVANISSNLGYTNKLSHDHNLYVTLNTNMPAVLIENGFLSNRDEAIRSANPSNQQKLADTIANTVKEMF